MANIDKYYRKDCDKLDASCIAADFKLSLDSDDKSVLKLETSWGDTEVDLEPAVKDAETLTSLKLTENSLCYYDEHGDTTSITGDALSRIISMTKLKDVDQTTAPVKGDVYIYDGDHFVTFNLTEALQNIYNRLTNIEAVIAKPDGIPDGTRLVWGNINLYSDYTNTEKKDDGFFTHSTSINRVDDEYFS